MPGGQGPMLRYSCYPTMTIPRQPGKCQAEDDAPPQHHECKSLNNLDNHTIRTSHRVQKDTDVEGVPSVFEELRQRVTDVVSDEAQQCALLSEVIMTRPEFLPDAMEALSPQEISRFVVSLHELILDHDAEDMSACEEEQEVWKHLQSSLKPHLNSEQGERLLLLYTEKLKQQKAEIDDTKACYDAVKEQMDKLLVANQQLRKENTQEKDERDAECDAKLAETRACLQVVTGKLDSVIAINNELGKNKQDAEKRSEELQRLLSEQELLFTEYKDGLKNANTEWKEANAGLKKTCAQLEKANDKLEKANDKLEAEKAELKKASQVESQDLTARIQRREKEMALERDQHCNELQLLHGDLYALRTEQDKEMNAMATEIYVSQQRQQEQQEVIDTLRGELQCAQQAQPANVTQAAPTASMSGHESRLLQQLCRMFECPISIELPEKAVLASDGHLYDETSLCSCLAGDSLSPLTRRPFALAATQMLCLQGVVDVLRQYEEHPETQGAQPPHIEGAELQQLKQQLQDAQNQLGQLEQELIVCRKVNQNLETQAAQAATQKKLERQKNEAEQVQLQTQIKRLTTAKSHIQAQIQAEVVQQTNKMHRQLQSQARILQENEDDALHKNNMLEQLTEENAKLTQANANLKTAIRHIHQVSAQCQ